MRLSVILLAVMVSTTAVVAAQQQHQNTVIDLWAQGKPAFGVYAPNERPGPGGQRGQPPQPAVYTRGGGETLAMNPLYDFVFLNLEDPEAVAQAKQIADLEGYSILACGIGSLAQALGGDRTAAEAGTLRVLEEAKRAKLADMLTANAQDVEKRVKEGFLALLMQGPTADEAITLGRAAAGR